MGRKGKYFIFAAAICDGTAKKKVNRSIRKAQKKPDGTYLEELHAVNMSLAKKRQTLKKVLSIDGVWFGVLVADKERLTFHRQHGTRNIGYNYLAGLLVKQVARACNHEDLHIIFDEHNTKVESRNSLAEYLRIKLLLECRHGGRVNIEQADSRNVYGLQVADLAANICYRCAMRGKDGELVKMMAMRTKIIRFPKKVDMW